MLQSVMKNSHGRLVFPSNFIPELDVTALDSLDTLEEVIQRDFESKAPSGTEILHRIEQGKYARRSDLLRDIAMNLFWTNRYGPSPGPLITTQSSSTSVVSRARMACAAVGVCALDMISRGRE